MKTRYYNWALLYSQRLHSLPALTASSHGLINKSITIVMYRFKVQVSLLHDCYVTLFPAPCLTFRSRLQCQRPPMKCSCVMVMVLPLQQVVYGLEQEGPALVGQPTPPQSLLSHWKTRTRVLLLLLLLLEHITILLSDDIFSDGKTSAHDNSITARAGFAPITLSKHADERIYMSR